MPASATRRLLPLALACCLATGAHAQATTPVPAPGGPASPRTEPATATRLSAAEAEQVRGIILAQIEALAEDDAERVFETTTPAVRAAIGSSGRFLAMVRGAYPMVYRPSAVSFHKPERQDDTVLQLVEITDSDDRSWLALFAVEQQPDQTWRISGCIVSSNPWRPA